MKNESGLVQSEIFGKEVVLDKRICMDNPIDCRNREPRLKPINRQQMLLRAVDVEKLISEDHEARAIWEFVGRLDLDRYYDDIEVVEGEAGRSAFDPQLKISLWIYSYSKGISSAREISRLCEYDPAYQWLTGMEPINHHTLSDFRIKNKEALDELFIQVLGLLSAEGLVTLERVMHDGTKVKACASGSTFRREERICKHLEIAKEQVKLMNEAQEEEVSSRVAMARKRACKEKEGRLELALQELKKIRAAKSGDMEKKEVRVSETDPEARIMKQGDGGYAPSYNMQISTDSAEKIIVGVGISQSGVDYEELVAGEERVEKNLGHAPEQLVVDGGFISRENIMAMNKKGVDLIGAMKTSSLQSVSLFNRRGIEPAFYPDKFRYDTDNNIYVCPAGKTLEYEGIENRTGYTNYKYRACAADCQECTFKQKCCPKNKGKGRSIMRVVNVPEVAEFIAKMDTEEAKDIYKQRGAVAEFPNAWIKDKIGLRQFHLRGLFKVGMEALWVCLTYNIQQWTRVCWSPQFA